MALEINRAPVLTGKAAREFWQKVEQSKESMSGQEIRELSHKWSSFFAQQKHLQYA